MILESSFQQLFASAVKAFPLTRARQHLIGDIEIANLHIIPYLGTKTLFIRADAHNTVENTDYRPIIVFKNVKYQQEGVKIVASDNGQTVHIAPLNHNDVLIRCQCLDFGFRFNFYNWQDRSLQGRVRPKYERVTDWAPPANPKSLPGGCKHCMSLFRHLNIAGLI